MLSFFGLGVVLLSLLTTVYFLNKHRKGIPLSKLGTASLIVGLTLDVILIVSILVPNTPFISEAWEQIPLSFQILIFLATIAIGLYLARVLFRKSRNPLDPMFKNLKIYYSNDQDSPYIDRHPNRPYYIVNNTSNQAYYVPDFMADFVRKGKIAWTAYADKETLHKYFESQSIKINLIDPSDEQLGL